MVKKLEFFGTKMKEFVSVHKRKIIVFEIFFLSMMIVLSLFLMYVCSALTVALSNYIDLSDRQGLLSIAQFSFFTSVMMGGILWLLIFNLYSLIKNKEWKVKKMSLTNNEIRTIFSKQVEEKIEEHLENYLLATGIPSKFVPRVIVDSLVSQYTTFDFDDFLKNCENRDEADVRTNALYYCNESYKYDLLQKEFDNKMNLEQIRLDLQDELVLMLTNTEPYGYAPRSYWDTRVRKVESVRELGKFIENDLESFIGKYASSWQYDSKEFSDE